MEQALVKQMNTDPSFEYLKGFEGYYKINKNGDLWSCSQHKFNKKQINESGYEWYKLTNGHITKGLVSRLLAIQYIPNPDNLPEVDHIDRNKLNNSLDNLRWVSRSENAKNKSNSLSLLTEEELEQRKEKIKEYKTEWARKDRIKKGIEPKRVIAEEDREEYKKEVYEKQKERIEKMTEEEYKLYRDKRNEDNKKCYSTNNGKEYQREYKKNKLQNMTQEERDIHNQKQRENYAKRKSRIISTYK